MTRAEVREFLRTGVDALTPVLEFGSGLLTDFNAQPDKTHPQVWQELRPVEGINPNNQAPVDEWNIRLHIAKAHNQQDVLPKDYEPFIDECDLVAQKLIHQYNKIVAGYKLVTITNRRREPFTKKFVHVMSGVILTFTLNAPDKTNVC